MIKYVIKESEEEIGQEIALRVVGKVSLNPRLVLGLATGSSPLSTYQSIVKTANEKNVSFSQVQTYNLDEYVALKRKDQSYRHFMDENLFKHLDFSVNSHFFPTPENPEKYDDIILKAGGIAVQILGIGGNGHIAFNEPHTCFSSLTHVVDLTEKTRLDNARFFTSIDEVPTQAVTMGLATIMKAKEIIIIILGNKADALKELLKNKPDEAFPASVLHNHPAVTLYTTKDLYQKAKSSK